LESLELTYYLALHLTSGIGSRRLLALMEYFGSAERAYHASVFELQKLPGFGKGTAQAFVEARVDARAHAERQIDQLGIDRCIITYFDPEYPEHLKTTYSPPPLLFIHGNPSLLQEEKMIAIVGSRRTTDYGRRVSREFSEGFVKDNVTVVSGFAKGIDTSAHHAAYSAGGKTLAVLGSGVDVIYPGSNKDLAKEMIESGRGALLSELPLGAKPDARNFPWRNRIVSGLSTGVVVVESEIQGGSMITASLALDQNRDVFAVPGDIDRPMSTGPNYLIRESRAKLAISAEQVLAELGWSSSSAARRQLSPVARTGLSLFENQIVDVLETAGEPIHIDSLAERAGLEVQEILVQLLGLEFKNVVRQMAGKQFTLVR
jgi:DNA processing protein